MEEEPLMFQYSARGLVSSSSFDCDDSVLGKQLPRLLSKKLAASLFPNAIETFTPFGGGDDGVVAETTPKKMSFEDISSFINYLPTNETFK